MTSKPQGIRPARPVKPTASARQPPRGHLAPIPKSEQQSEQNRARSERSTAAYVGLGIRTIEWHPSGEYLAVGGWDGKVSTGGRLHVALASQPSKHRTSGFKSGNEEAQLTVCPVCALLSDPCPESVRLGRGCRTGPPNACVRWCQVVGSRCKLAARPALSHTLVHTSLLQDGLFSRACGALTSSVCRRYGESHLNGWKRLEVMAYCPVRTGNHPEMRVRHVAFSVMKGLIDWTAGARSRVSGPALPAAVGAPARPDAAKPSDGHRPDRVESIRPVLCRHKWFVAYFPSPCTASPADRAKINAMIFLSVAAGYPTVVGIYSFPLPTSATNDPSLGQGNSQSGADSATNATAASNRFQPCRLHTVLLFSPDPAANEGPGPGGYAAQVRDLAWQPRPSEAQIEDDEVDYGEETFASDEADGEAGGGGGANRRDETLVVITGQKGFATWRAPRARDDRGLAECVGIPARACFLSRRFLVAGGRALTTHLLQKPTLPLLRSHLHRPRERPSPLPSSFRPSRTRRRRTTAKAPSVSRIRSLHPLQTVSRLAAGRPPRARRSPCPRSSNISSRGNPTASRPLFRQTCAVLGLAG